MKAVQRGARRREEGSRRHESQEGSQNKHVTAESCSTRRFIIIPAQQDGSGWRRTGNRAGGGRQDGRSNTNHNTSQLQIPTLTRWQWTNWSAGEQTADYRRLGEARGCPRTCPPLRGVSWGTGSRQRWGEQLQPVRAPGGWAGSGCLMRRSVVSGWAWVPCCCGSNTADRSRPGPTGWPGVRQRPAGRGGYTAAGPAVWSPSLCWPAPEMWDPRCSCIRVDPGLLYPGGPGSCAPEGWRFESHMESILLHRWPIPSTHHCPGPRTGRTGSGERTGSFLEVKETTFYE